MIYQHPKYNICTVKSLGIFGVFLLIASQVWAQGNVGIGTSQPNPHAVLELVAPQDNQGFLTPRLSTLQRTANSFTGQLSASDNGLMVFDTDEKAFYFWQENAWRPIMSGAQAGGALTGTYPAPALRENTVSTAQLTDGAVTSGKIADNTLEEKDFKSPGALRVLTTTSSGAIFWDDQSIFLSALGQGRVYVGNSASRPEAVDLRGIGNILVGNGTTAAPVSVNGDLTLSSAGNAQIVAGAIGSEEVQDNSLTNADINENAAIVGSKINPVFGTQNISTTGNLTVQDINANGNLIVTGKARSAATAATDNAATLTTKDYVDNQIAATTQTLSGGRGITSFTYNGKQTATLSIHAGTGLDFDGSTALQVADEGITAAKISADVAGQGITKNAVSGKLDLDINKLGMSGASEDNDLLAIYNASAGQVYKISRADLLNAENITAGTLSDARLPAAGPGAQVFNTVSSIEVDAKGRVVSVNSAPSDRRLKKDISPLTQVLPHVLQMQGYRYHWKNPDSDTTLQIGLIAQELQKIYPELVRSRPDGYLSIDYVSLIPVLAEAIKEQQVMIQRLQIQSSQAENNLQQMEHLRQENKAIRSELQIIKSMLEQMSPAVHQP